MLPPLSWTISGAISTSGESCPLKILAITTWWSEPPHAPPIPILYQSFNHGKILGSICESGFFVFFWLCNRNSYQFSPYH